MRLHFIMCPATLLLSGALLVNTGCGFLWSCIASGARVATPHGPWPIEDLEVGDTIYCFDEQSGERHETRITARRKATRECVRLKTSSGQELVVTSDHPIYDPVEGIYTHAGDWVLGKRDTLWVLGDEETPFFHERVEIAEIDAGLHEVFDLSVEHELHNFVANGILVHNKSVGPYGPPPGSAVSDPRCDETDARIKPEDFGAFSQVTDYSTQTMTIPDLEEAAICTYGVKVSTDNDTLVVSQDTRGWYGDVDVQQILIKRAGEEPEVMEFAVVISDRVVFFEGEQQVDGLTFGAVGERRTVRLEYRHGDHPVAAIERSESPRSLLEANTHYTTSHEDAVEITSYTDTQYEYWEIELLELHETITITPYRDSTLTLRQGDPEPLE